MIYAAKASRRETVFGGIYLILYLMVMSWLIPVAAHFVAPRLGAAQVNFLYFAVNFAATSIIFRKFLVRSMKDTLRSPGPALWYALLGYLGSNTLNSFVAMFILQLDPDFANVNDAAINAMVAENFGLMAIGAVVLAPITEELLFRGLIFRGLYDRSPLAAHLVSMLLFSAIHVSGYVGLYDPKTLVLCFIQYLPPAYCLNFAYRYGRSIVSPILMHMMINLAALSLMR